MEILKNRDREVLIQRLIEELPGIRKEMEISAGGIAESIGIEAENYRSIEKGERDMKWSEFMSILFILWSSDAGRGPIEEKDLFPEALKNAMSINRNEHLPSPSTNRRNDGN